MQIVAAHIRWHFAFSWSCLALSDTVTSKLQSVTSWSRSCFSKEFERVDAARSCGAVVKTRANREVNAGPLALRKSPRGSGALKAIA